jgi:hypothetical protein
VLGWLIGGLRDGCTHARPNTSHCGFFSLTDKEKGDEPFELSPIPSGGSSSRAPPDDTDDDSSGNINEGWKTRQRSNHIVETPSSEGGGERPDVESEEEPPRLPDATTTTLHAFNGENSPLRMAMKRVMASSVHDISLTHVASEIDQHWPRGSHALRYQEPLVWSPLPLQLQTTPSSVSSPISGSKRSTVSGMGSASVQPHNTAQPQQQSSLVSLSTPLLSSSILTSGSSNSNATAIHHYHHDGYQASTSSLSSPMPSSSSDSLLGKPDGVTPTMQNDEDNRHHHQLQHAQQYADRSNKNINQLTSFASRMTIDDGFNASGVPKNHVARYWTSPLISEKTGLKERWLMHHSSHVAMFSCTVLGYGLDCNDVTLQQWHLSNRSQFIVRQVTDILLWMSILQCCCL